MEKPSTELSLCGAGRCVKFSAGLSEMSQRTAESLFVAPSVLSAPRSVGERTGADHSLCVCVCVHVLGCAQSPVLYLSCWVC